MTPNEFLNWLVNQKPFIIIFEACGTTNYWKQKALEAGHDARLISAKLVSAVRQNQKTDKNDALTIIQASLLPEVNFIDGKNIKQQQLQSIKRLRELAVKQRDAIQKQVIALLLELNIRCPNKSASLLKLISDVLEDGENNLLFEFRQALETAKITLTTLIEAVFAYDDCMNNVIQADNDCKKFLKLEGVGSVNAANLYIELGCSESTRFNKGKDASACIGVTPIQYSSGSKIKIGTIGKTKNSLLRSQLITGSMAFVRQVVKREPKTTKEVWLKALAERRGNKCAAVALANKTVRTAFAMIKNSTEYKAALIAA